MRRKLGRRRGSVASDLPLSDHLRELRRRFLRSLFAVAAGMVVGYVVFVPLLSWLTEPYCSAVGAVDSCNLIALSPLQPLSLRLYGSFLVGLILAWPVVLWNVWRFVVPALTLVERRVGMLVLLFGQLLLVSGVALALFLVPTALEVLLGMAGPGVVPMLDATAYVRFLVALAIAFGILFQLPLVLVALISVGALSTKTLRSRRKEAVIVGAIVAAVVTPTGDAVTLSFALVILAVLYEVAILVGRAIERRKRRRRP